MTETTWENLLQRAVNEPGKISEAYNRFHGYSIGNQFLALLECYGRGIEPGPLASYKAWQKLGRQVRRGEQAICLWMPFTGHAKEIDEATAQEVERTWTYFKLLPRWFVLSQTDGEPIPEVSIPGWERAKAASALEIEIVAFSTAPFASLDGNIQGYATGKRIAINPLATRPDKTTFHEIAHVLLGHTGEGDLQDGARIVKDLIEAEAESVALICCEALGLDGTEECRGYIQDWWGTGHAIPETSARRIFGVAQKVLEAGRGSLEEAE